MMNMGERAQLSTHTPQFTAPAEKCPYCPTAVVIVSIKGFAPPKAQAVFAGLVAHPAVFAQTESRLRISQIRSRQKRGPPVSL